MKVVCCVGASAGRRRARTSLGGLALAVGCAHAALLVAPSQPASPRVDVERRSAVKLRSIHLPVPVPAIAPVPAPAANETTAARPENRSRPEAQSIAATVHEPPAQSAEASLSGSFADPSADYLPRSALSVAPRPQQPVLIDFPSFVGEAERYSGEFEIFIDDSGGVVRVVPDDASLPPVLVQAVRDAFLPARFVPGEVDGLAVRSRIRIEVIFESRSAPG